MPKASRTAGEVKIPCSLPTGSKSHAATHTPKWCFWILDLMEYRTQAELLSWIVFKHLELYGIALTGPPTCLRPFMSHLRNVLYGDGNSQPNRTDSEVRAVPPGVFRKQGQTGTGKCKRAMVQCAICIKTSRKSESVRAFYPTTVISSFFSLLHGTKRSMRLPQCPGFKTSMANGADHDHCTILKIYSNLDNQLAQFAIFSRCW
ncbi:hypothetical protein EI94DRAFT_1790394 [Lactarius quietus]|nr:hypothetical protein EI94DRAFT_1790394 [Lactarius quietus]